MGNQHTIDQLCNDEGLAILYGFSAARNFATILRDETGGSVMRDMSTAIDFDSIMCVPQTILLYPCNRED